MEVDYMLSLVCVQMQEILGLVNDKRPFISWWLLVYVCVVLFLIVVATLGSSYWWDDGVSS